MSNKREKVSGGEGNSRVKEQMEPYPASEPGKFLGMEEPPEGILDRRSGSPLDRPVYSGGKQALFETYVLEGRLTSALLSCIEIDISRVFPNKRHD